MTRAVGTKPARVEKRERELYNIEFISGLYWGIYWDNGK